MARHAILTDEELDIAFTIAKNGSLKKHELNQHVHTLSQTYARSEKSLYILTVRLFYIIHGRMPENITKDVSWYSASKTLINFVLSRGHCISKEVKEEMSKNKPVISRKQALNLMSEYYKDNRLWMPDSIKEKRDYILNLIQSGKTPDDAFMEAIQKI